MLFSQDIHKMLNIIYLVPNLEMQYLIFIEMEKKLVHALYIAKRYFNILSFTQKCKVILFSMEIYGNMGYCPNIKCTVMKVTSLNR